MQNQTMNKEWYNKNEILDLYPIGITTYKRRIRKLNSPAYKDYTRMLKKELKDSNLKSIQVREIHKDILKDLFGDIRVPDLNNVNSVIKWVNNCDWDWFGVIIPAHTLPIELKAKMNFLFSKLKKEFGRKSELVVFYSIEPNTTDNYYHCHFLIRNGTCQLSKEILMKHFGMICEANTASERRIYLKNYDYQKYNKSGSNYTLKQLEYGYEILK